MKTLTWGTDDTNLHYITKNLYLKGIKGAAGVVRSADKGRFSLNNWLYLLRTLYQRFIFIQKDFFLFGDICWRVLDPYLVLLLIPPPRKASTSLGKVPSFRQVSCPKDRSQRKVCMMASLLNLNLNEKNDISIFINF